MKFQNTLTRKTETFKPLKEGQVKLYTCGPTVYDYYHIGNLRNAVFNDTLRRTLESKGYKVRHVMNITDVGHLVSDDDEGEDKLEKGAQREGKTVQQVAMYYTDAFKTDMDALNVLPPNGYSSTKYKDNYARATEFIDQQIELINLLLDEGLVYQTSQAIYFDVTKLASYGELSGQKLADKITSRDEVVSDPNKRHPQDFAVWFFLVDRFKNHSMHWSSPWGDGFPGWHLECSAIVHSTLDDPIDIHTGGVDHIGTHHPNEMAQTEGAYGHKLANYWLHNEFILVDGAKMAKSKGNSYILKDVTSKGFDPLALRLLYLQSHYRKELNFSWDNLAAAQNRLHDLRAWADLRHQPSTDEMSEELDGLFYKTRNSIIEALENDLNTPLALSILGQLVSYMQTVAIPQRDGKHTDGMLKFLDSIFGLNLDGRPDISSEQKKLIADRDTARQNQDWATSDKIRDELEKQGIGIRDSSFGTQWFRHSS